MTILSTSLQRLAQIASGPAVERIGKTLLHSLWEIAAVALVVILLLRLLRRSDPSVRYSVACAAMVLMTVLPALTFMSIEAKSSGALQANVEDAPPTYASATPQSEPWMEIQTNSIPGIPAETQSQIDSVASSTSTPSKLHRVPSLEAPKSESAPSRYMFQQSLDRILPWLVAAWALGVLFFSLKTLTSWFLLRRLRSESQPVFAGEPITILHQIASRLGITRTLRLARSSLVDVPTVFGWISPVVVLPTSALCDLCPTHLKALLAHELAHVRRHDYLVNFVQRALEALLFYHPAVWWVSTRIRCERELCCDDVAAGFCGDRVQYAAALLRMEEVRLSHSGGLALAAGGGDLLARIRRLAGQGESSRSPGLWPAGIISLMLVAMPLFALRAASNEGDDVEKVEAPQDQAAPHDLSGTVIGKDQQPVSGATVFIYSAGVREGSDTLCPSCYPDCSKQATTNDTGQFKIKSLDPKLTFRVLVARDGFEPQFATKVDPASGPLKVALEPRFIQAADPKLLIRGRVLDHEGHPVLGAVLSPKSVRQSETTRFGSDILDPVAVTNADGEFLISAKQAFDAAVLLVEARGFAKKISSEIVAGETVAEIILAPGCVVSGSLTREGSPVAGAKIGLVQESRNSATFLGPLEIATDSNGVWLFNNVAPDDAYQVYALVDSVPGGGVTEVKRIVTGLDGQRLDVGALEVIPGVTVGGQVVLADGKPVPPATRIGLYRESAWDHSHDILDEEGRFELTGVRGEVARLSLRVPGYHLSTRNESFLPLRNNLTGILDDERKNLLVLLEPGDPKFSFPRSQEEQSRGFARERELQRKSLQGAPPDWQERSIPDAKELSDGIDRRHFEKPSHVGLPESQSAKDSSQASESPIRAKPLMAAEESKTTKTFSIAGLVHNPDGNPIADATVRILHEGTDPANWEIARMATGTDGRFIFDDLTVASAEEGPIRCSVLVSKPGLSSAVRFFSTESSKEIDATLAPPAILRGRVLDERDNGIAGANVFRLGIAEEPFPEVWSAVTDEQGYYEITDLPPWRAGEGESNEFGLGFPSRSKHSRMIFVVRKAGYAKVHGSYGEVPATVDVHLRQAATIEGKVIDGVTGLPVAGAQIQSQRVETFPDGSGKLLPGDSATTDATGAFRLDALEEGKVRLWARVPGRAVSPLGLISVTAGETKHVDDITLTEGGFVEGRVVDVDTGKPVSQAYGQFAIRVATSRDGIVLDSARVADDGTFRARAPAGRVTVYVQLEQDRRDGSIRTSGYADVVEGETTTLPSFRIRSPKSAEDR